MKRLFPVLAALLLAACKLFDPFEDLHSTSPPRPGSTPRSMMTSTTGIQQTLRQRDTIVYITGVEYPASYDWRRDSLDGQTQCRLVVFAGQRRILEVPAGPGTAISAEPDRHRICDGHLYTDCAVGGETVICCDGFELFRYDGEEVLCGFLVSDGDVFTLGYPPSGRGFHLRRNGTPVFSSESGVVCGSPEDSSYPDGALGAGLQFCYYEGDNPRRWFCYRGGRSEELAVPQGSGEVYDAKLIDGKPYVACRLTPSSSAICYYGGSQTVHIQGFSVSQILSSSIMPDGLHFKASCISTSGLVQMFFWWRGMFPIYSSDDRRFVEFYQEGGSVAGILCRGNTVCDVYRDGEYLPLENVRFLRSPCAALCGGRFFAAFSPTERHLSPFLWVEGKHLALALNGYPTGIYIKIN